MNSIVDFKPIFISQFNKILNCRDNLEDYLDEIERAIGVSDDNYSKFYKGINTAYDNLVEITDYIFKDFIPKDEIIEDMDYLLFEGGGFVEKKFNNEYFRFSTYTPEEVYEMWEKEISINKKPCD